jgi:rhamnopyranosyl-N-acetylglucosaminyl-diphospho-decaprenol beta-1,3/1,4-galactofuranosyltransferase
MNKIGIAIVTFNRLNYLKICLQKLSQQTYQNYEILVVNNNSTDGTKEFLIDLDVHQIHLNENTGPAGGFNEAIKFFLSRRGYDYLWLMDDDVFPAKDCLAELLISAEVHKEEADKVIYPSIRSKDFKAIEFPGWSGILIPFFIANRAGLPIKKLFFFAEDTEYIQHRIRQMLSCRIIRATKAKVVHFTICSKERKSWVYYYETRNLLYYRLHIQKGRRLIRMKQMAIASTRLLFLSIISKNPKSFHFYCKGLKDGLLGRIGKTVDPLAC